jgi:hypothetical protein
MENWMSRAGDLIPEKLSHHKNGVGQADSVFLIVNVPHLGATSAAQAMGSVDSAEASRVSAAFDSTLGNAGCPIPCLPTLAAEGSIDIFVINSYPLLDAIVGDSTGYGFSPMSLCGIATLLFKLPCGLTLALQPQV